MGSKLWTSAEDEIIKSHYADGIDIIMRKFHEIGSRRTPSAVYRRAWLLNSSISRNRKRQNHKKTPEPSMQTARQFHEIEMAMTSNANIN